MNDDNSNGRNKKVNGEKKGGKLERVKNRQTETMRNRSYTILRYLSESGDCLCIARKKLLYISPSV